MNEYFDVNNFLDEKDHEEKAHSLMSTDFAGYRVYVNGSIKADKLDTDLNTVIDKYRAEGHNIEIYEVAINWDENRIEEGDTPVWTK